MMYYYAYLDERNIVQMILTLPSQITDNRYISIPTNDQSLVGKRYNRETKQFEDVIMFYYAVLGNKDIVKEVISSETEIVDTNKIKIATKDTSLIGKWYNRGTGQFQTPPIHILAELNTQQINIVGQDIWLQSELDKINASIANLKNKSFSGYQCSFDIEDNEETTSEWVNGKNYVYSFNTGIPGYFPKMIRIVNSQFGNDTLVAELYIAKKEDGSIKYAYLDKNYLGRSLGSGVTGESRLIKHNVKAKDSNVFEVGRSNNGERYNEGGSAFFQEINPNGAYVEVGNFNYTENTLSFTMTISRNLIGSFTSIDLRCYVF